MGVRHDLSVEELRRLLRLDPETGRLYWLHRGPEWFKDGQQTAEHCAARWNSMHAGKEALTASTGAGGYLVGAIGNRIVRAHHVVFALHHGRWPAYIDHRDGNSLNNRPANLREATHAQNMANRRTGRKAKSRYRGLTWIPSRERWKVMCARRYCGFFKAEEDAARAYDHAARLAYGEFARLNFP